MLLLQKFINSIGDIKIANDFLKEKHGGIVRPATVSLSGEVKVATEFYLYENCPQLTDGRKFVILDKKSKIVYASPKGALTLDQNNKNKVDWTIALGMHEIKGVPLMVYDYMGQPFVASANDPQALDLIPGKQLNYRDAICEYLVDRSKLIFDKTNILYLFKPTYYYYLIYNHSNRIDETTLTLVAAVHTKTLDRVTDAMLDFLAKELNLQTPSGEMVISYTDAYQVLDFARHKSKKLYITDSKNYFKIV